MSENENESSSPFEEFVLSDEQLRECFFDLKSVPSDVPPEVAIAIRGDSVSQLWKYGHDKDIVKIALAMPKYKLRFVAPVTRFRVRVDGNVEVFFPNEIRLVIPIQHLGDTPEQVISNLRAYYYVKRNGGRYSFKILKPATDIKSAVYMLANIPAITSLCYCFGVDTSMATALLYFPRFVTLFRHPSITPPTFYVMQMTRPNSGKSYLGIAYMITFNWEYITAMPTPARLVFDAARNTFGVVYTKNGIIFDEVDKWKSGDRQHFRQTYSILLTGLENGVWSRETSRFYYTERIRYVPVIMYTNVRQRKIEDVGARDEFEYMVGEWGGWNAHAFVDRFSIVQMFIDEYAVTDHVLGYQAVPSLRKGVIRVLQRLYAMLCREKIPPTSYDGRRKREYYKLYPLVRLFFSQKPEYAQVLTESFIDCTLTVDEFEEMFYEGYDKDFELSLREKVKSMRW